MKKVAGGAGEKYRVQSSAPQSNSKGRPKITKNAKSKIALRVKSGLEFILENRIHEGSDSRRLGQGQQNSKNQQCNHDGNKPPFFAPYEITEKFGYD